MYIAKPRILNERLAAIVASLRHGETVFIADAGSSSAPQSLAPLPPEVEIIDLSAVTGSPRVADLVRVLWEVGDFERAVVTDEMTDKNPEGRREIEGIVGAEQVTSVPYTPDLYRLRSRAKAFVQTGDYSVHGNVLLVGGYSSDLVPMAALLGDE